MRKKTGLPAAHRDKMVSLSQGVIVPDYETFEHVILPLGSHRHTNSTVEKVLPFQETRVNRKDRTTTFREEQLIRKDHYSNLAHSQQSLR